MRQTLARYDGHVIDTTRLDRAGRAALYHQQGECLICGRPVLFKLSADQAEAYFAHLPGNPLSRHEPESIGHRRAKLLLGRRLRALFPTAQIAENVPLDSCDHIADLVVMTTLGGRMAFEVTRADMPVADLERAYEGYATERIQAYWFMSADRMRLTGRPGLLRKLAYGEMETWWLRRHGELRYLDPVEGDMIVVTAHPGAMAAARLGKARLGRVESIVRHYPLGQLRLRAGALAVLSEYDDPAPAWGALPKGLQTWLDRRQPSEGQVPAGDPARALPGLDEA